MPRGKLQRSMDLIGRAHGILEEIQPATVRAVCYRLFVAGLIPNMAKSATNGVSNQLVYARERRIIPWEWVVDETREAEIVSTWADPEEYADAVQDWYRRDRWQEQPHRVEVWSEKGTVRGTLAPVLDRYAVTFRVMHGYGSATVINDVAEQTCNLAEPLIVFYVGDRDPSGMHMSAVDLPTRLADYGANVILTRLALTMEDCVDRNLPGFDAEAKHADTRWQWYVDNFGDRCWELDALNPNILRTKVETAIRELIDQDAWARADKVEQLERESLVDILAEWKAASA